jgi:hypothetical protein
MSGEPDDPAAVQNLRAGVELHALLGSSSAEEAQTAREKLLKLLAEHGLTWNDLPAIIAATAAADTRYQSLNGWRGNDTTPICALASALWDKPNCRAICDGAPISFWIGLPKQFRQPSEVYCHPPGLLSGEHRGLAGGLFVGAEIDPPHGLPGRILHPKRLGVLDDGPGRREAAGGHSKSLARLSTRRRISREASSPDNILPICSGGIDAIILALTSRPSPKETPRSEAPDHRGHAGLEHRRCFNNDDTNRRPPGIAKSQ